MISFIILFGTRTTPKMMGQLPYVCPRCQQNAWHHYVRRSKWFTFFFIPVIPLGDSTYAHCGLCGFQQMVPNQHADHMFAQQRMLAQGPPPPNAPPPYRG